MIDPRLACRFEALALALRARLGTAIWRHDIAVLDAGEIEAGLRQRLQQCRDGRFDRNIFSGPGGAAYHRRLERQAANG